MLVFIACEAFIIQNTWNASIIIRINLLFNWNCFLHVPNPSFSNSKYNENHRAGASKFVIEGNGVWDWIKLRIAFVMYLIAIILKSWWNLIASLYIGRTRCKTPDEIKWPANANWKKRVMEMNNSYEMASDGWAKETCSSS